MKYVSLFAGIGGFDLALDRHGHECVYANDFDKYCKITYDKNFKHKLDTTPITDVAADAIPDHDLLVGGFPCQAFSIAGKRKGFDEARGTLFFDIARILRHHQTKYFVLENVKGLLNHDGGRTFRVIIKTLTELGYDLQWQVLNSKNFGVPQNRERVFIIGNLRGQPRPQIFPFQGANSSPNEGIVSTTLDSNYWKGIDNHGQRTAIYDASYPSRIRTYKTISPTIRDYGSGGNKMPIVEGIRRLTPLECERLQGFPDNWTQYGQIITQYNIIGNIWDQLKLNVVSINAKDKQLLENQHIALCITKDGENGGMQISSMLNSGQIQENAGLNIVSEVLTQENGVCDTTSLGKDMVMLYSQNEISNIETITNRKNILEKMEKKSIYPLWNLCLEKNLSKEKLSTILILIKEIIRKKIFICAKTEKPITNVIIHSKKLEQNYLRRDLLVLRMVNTILMSDTQRYKQLGNAVTVNVIEAIVSYFI